MACLGTLVGSACGALTFTNKAYRYEFGVPPGWQASGADRLVKLVFGHSQDCWVKITATNVRRPIGAKGIVFLQRTRKTLETKHRDVTVVQAVHHASLGDEPGWAQTLAYRNFLGEMTVEHRLVASRKRSGGEVHLFSLTAQMPNSLWKNQYRAVAFILSTFTFLDKPPPEEPSPPEPPPPVASRPRPRSSYPTASSQPTQTAWATPGLSGTSSGKKGGASGKRRPTATGDKKPGKRTGKTDKKRRDRHKLEEMSAEEYWRRILERNELKTAGKSWKLDKSWNESFERQQMDAADAHMYGQGMGPSDNNQRTAEEQERALSFFNPTLMKEQ